MDDQARLRDSISEADRNNLKQDEDVVIDRGQRLIVRASDTGMPFRVEIVAGALKVTAL